eukprot:3491348-Rhodomonas_salina.2
MSECPANWSPLSLQQDQPETSQNTTQSLTTNTVTGHNNAVTRAYSPASRAPGPRRVTRGPGVCRWLQPEGPTTTTTSTRNSCPGTRRCYKREAPKRSHPWHLCGLAVTNPNTDTAWVGSNNGYTSSFCTAFTRFDGSIRPSRDLRGYLCRLTPRWIPIRCVARSVTCGVICSMSVRNGFRNSAAPGRNSYRG